MSTRHVYKDPKPGQPLITTISSGCKTPVLGIKFCNLTKPFYYPNSQIPRYSITCVLEPENNRDFIKEIQSIEKNEKVETVIKNDYVKEGKEHFTTGNLILKFQSKELIPVYAAIDGKEKYEQIELEDELARGEKVMIVYEILRYTKKNTMQTQHGISFKPSCIYYFPTKPLSEISWKQ